MHYVNDVRDGPYQLKSDLCDTVGEFRAGKKHGEWKTTEQGKLFALQTFKDGVPHGRHSGESEGHTAFYDYVIVDGHLDWSDRHTQAHPLFRKALGGEIDDESILKALRDRSPNDLPTPVRWDSSLEMPLADLSAIHGVPIVLDPQVAIPMAPQPAQIYETDLGAQLLQLAQLYKVVLDYRDGSVFVTVPNSGSNPE
jgi:hypothetical protein